MDAHKTKAALQGRLCHFSDIAENDSTLIDLVNASRFAHIFPGCCKSTNVTAPTLLIEAQKFTSAICPKLDASSALLIRWVYSASMAPSKVKGGVSIIGHTPKGIINSLISSRNANGVTGFPVSLTSSLALHFYPIGGKGLRPQNEVIGEIRCLQIHAPTSPQIWGDILAPEKSGDYYCKAFSQPVRRMSCSFFPQNESGPKHDLRRITATIIMAAKIKIFLIAQSCDSVVRAFLWRLLISFLAAAIRNPAVLSSGFFTVSINSRSSSGSLTEICSDLLFLLPVAMTESPYYWWCSVCLRKILNQALTWCSPANILVVFTSFELVSRNDEARKCANTNRASYHNVIEAYIMAEQQHTQTRSKFTWRFLAVGESTPDMRPVVLYTNATTEKEARDNCPGWSLYFAARLPLHTPEIMGVRHA